MRSRIRRLAWACLLAALCFGCSGRQEAPAEKGRPPIEPGPESTVRTDPPAKPALPGSAPAAAGTPAGKATPSGEQTPPFRVCALLNRKDGVARVGIEQNETGFSRVLKEGDSFWGYRLSSVDYEGKSAVFRKGEKDVTLRLAGGAAPRNQVEGPEFLRNLKNRPVANAGDPFKNVDMSKIKRKEFEPTDWEIEAGIDPNDPSTWPAGYRGPAIERLIRKYPPKKNQVNLPLESAKKAGAFKED